MKRILLAMLLLLALANVQAQRRRTKIKNEPGPQLPYTKVEEALAAYDFETAEELLNDEIEMLKKNKQSSIEQEKKLLWIHRAQMKLNAVEQVTFIDSIVVPINDVLRHIHLSPECGTISTYADYFKTADKHGCTVFQSQMGDQIFYAQPDARGVLNLYSQTLYSDGSKSKVELLQGISDKDSHQNFPFMMTDGTTIYFASQGTESLGGYDIFMSRYDADEHRFLAPENIGMPFNSTANDYLYLIDETNQLGWFVTDRNQPTGKVCIYVFIPNDTRQVYVPEELETEKLRRLARLTSIKETWIDSNEVRAAQYRLRETKDARQAENEHEFEFIITDNQIYHKRADFRSTQALQIFDQRVKDLDELYKVTKTLMRMRNNYSNSSEAQRNQMKNEILMLEKNEEELLEQVKNQEKEIRKLELGL